MKIVNKTTWGTEQLRDLFKLICKKEDFEEPRTVEVVYMGYRGLRCLGQAVVGNHNWVRLMMSDRTTTMNDNGRSQVVEMKEYSGLDVIGLAQVFVHELQHTDGLRHREMMDSNKFNVDYVKGIVIKRKEVEPMPKRDLRRDRYDHALTMLKNYELKRKRIINLLKKWGRKVKYYERVMKNNKN
jgi:hypothetical protein